MQRYLILEDGTEFKGTGFGADVEIAGEVVFNTGMTGYQETITDESYCNQIITFTYPLIGNYGISAGASESIIPSCSGVIVHELARRASNWTNEMTLDEFLKQHNIPGITGIDTRRLTRHLRDQGVMRGVITDNPEAAQSIFAKPARHDQVAQVATPRPYPSAGTGLRVVLVDFGLKHSILAELSRRACNVTVVPYNTSFAQIAALHPDGILLSNGPGDPEDVPSALPLIRELEQHYPMLGICLGHQLFALANGAKTVKMRFGHRGFNHAVREIATGSTFFTAQNHGYAVDADSIDGTDLMVTHEEINDNTVEGLRHRNYPVISVQFHPDATPGPHDATGIFDDFCAMMKNARQERKEQPHA
jgi:carbamoyl-phosphate synthase small subunit